MEVVGGEEDEADLLEVVVAVEEVLDGGQGDVSGLFDGEAVGSGADGGEGNGFDVVLLGELEGIEVGVAEELLFVVFAFAVDGAHGVYDVLGGQAACGGDDGMACGAAALLGDDFLAFLEDLRAAGAVDGAIDASAAHEGGVGGVDDGLGVLAGDIALGEEDEVVHGVLPGWSCKVILCKQIRVFSVLGGSFGF